MARSRSWLSWSAKTSTRLRTSATPSTVQRVAREEVVLKIRHARLLAWMKRTDLSLVTSTAVRFPQPYW